MLVNLIAFVFFFHTPCEWNYNFESYPYCATVQGYESPEDCFREVFREQLNYQYDGLYRPKYDSQQWRTIKKLIN